MRTRRHESGLIPSVLGESAGLIMVTPRMLTFWQWTGLIVQLGELIAVISSINKLLQSEKLMRRGRGCASAPSFFACHHFAPRPSMVPRPVMEMLLRFCPVISGAYVSWCLPSQRL